MLSISEKLNVFIEGLKGLKSLKRNGMKNMLALSQERFSARKFTSEAVVRRIWITSWNVCVWHHRQ